MGFITLASPTGANVPHFGVALDATMHAPLAPGEGERLASGGQSGTLGSGIPVSAEKQQMFMPWTIPPPGGHAGVILPRVNPSSAFCIVKDVDATAESTFESEKVSSSKHRKRRQSDDDSDQDDTKTTAAIVSIPPHLLLPSLIQDVHKTDLLERWTQRHRLLGISTVSLPGKWIIQDSSVASAMSTKPEHLITPFTVEGEGEPKLKKPKLEEKANKGKTKQREALFPHSPDAVEQNNMVPKEWMAAIVHNGVYATTLPTTPIT